MNIEKYLIYKLNTNKIECKDTGGQGIGNVLYLIDFEKGFNKAVIYNSKEEVEQVLKSRKESFENNKNYGEIYWYDSETTPYNLGILKLTIKAI